ncbi:MAG: hypothetical protein ACO3FA_00890 [Vulcanococcus sp.]
MAELPIVISDTGGCVGRLRWTNTISPADSLGWAWLAECLPPEIWGLAWWSDDWGL